MSLHNNVIQQLRAAVDTRDFDPFPHFFATNVFPKKVYADILAALDGVEYHAEKFKNRLFGDPSSIPELDFMKTPSFLKDVLNLFPDEVDKRFGGENNVPFSYDLRLVRDNENYKIGPHTDAAWKVVSLLFYLPENDSLRDYGTAIYVPKDPTFRCKGGPHYKFDGFEMVDRAPFIPNSCFGFWKTDNSFHGVPPITVPVERNVLLYNIYHKEPAGRP
jgi:hypothetical protein